MTLNVFLCPTLFHCLRFCFHRPSFSLFCNFNLPLGFIKSFLLSQYFSHSFILLLILSLYYKIFLLFCHSFPISCFHYSHQITIFVWLIYFHFTYTKNTLSTPKITSSIYCLEIIYLYNKYPLQDKLLSFLNNVSLSHANLITNFILYISVVE